MALTDGAGEPVHGIILRGDMKHHSATAGGKGHWTSMRISAAESDCACVLDPAMHR